MSKLRIPKTPKQVARDLADFNVLGAAACYKFPKSKSLASVPSISKSKRGRSGSSSEVSNKRSADRYKILEKKID